jgi:uncharacterized protein (DUF1697 family)
LAGCGYVGFVPTHVALLRGINLGGRNRVAMPALRETVASLGHRDVATYIQSGNVVFTPAKRGRSDKLAAALEQGIEQQLGVAARVVVLSRAEVAKVVDANPYADEPNLKAVHAIFLTENPDAKLKRAVAAANEQAAANGTRDEARVLGRALFLHTPDGYGRSKLAATIMRSPTGTARNWATVTKLLSMLDG